MWVWNGHTYNMAAVVDLVDGEVQEENRDQQAQEMESMLSIYSREVTVLKEDKEYLISVCPNVKDAIEVLLDMEKLEPLPLPVTDVAHPPLLRRLSSAPPKSTYVSHLPPVTLYICYHDNYPSHEPPRFHLTARWLHHRHIPMLSDKLRTRFVPGWPVVFDWMSYITDELVQDYCNLQYGDEKPPHQSIENAPRMFLRSISQFNDVEEHDGYEQHKEFLSEKHECEICCESRAGTQFAERCRECKGTGLYCIPCITEYCKTAIVDGRAAAMTCPGDCGCGLSDALVRNVLDDSLFNRYVHLREQIQLDSIPGMVFCPRSSCRSRIISDPSSDLAVCENCGFPFCKRCQQTWHGVETCPAFQKVEQREASVEDGSKKKPRTDEEAQRRIEELKSMVWIRSSDSVKQCPRCGANIQKIGGCNKMTCYKCGRYFCWICGTEIMGYEHFDFGGCKLFRNQDYLSLEEEKDSDEKIPEKEEELEDLLMSSCPRCDRVASKTSDHNWLHCSRCQLQFCHLCREPCYGRYHFSEYGCQEYTTVDQDRLWFSEQRAQTETKTT